MSGKTREGAGKKSYHVNKNSFRAIPDPDPASGNPHWQPGRHNAGVWPRPARWVANLIVDVLQQPDDAALLERTHEEVLSVSSRYPLPGLPD